MSDNGSVDRLSPTQRHPKVRRRTAAIINLVFGVAGIAISLLNGFLLVPLYLSYFSVATFGAWLASGGTLSLIAIFDSGIALVATQRLGKSFGRNDLTGFARESGSSIVVTLLIAVCVFLFCLPIAFFSPYWFSCPENDITSLQCANILSALRVGLMTLMYTVGAIPQSLQRAGVAGAILLGGQLIGVAVTLASLSLGWGVISLGVGQLTIAVVMLVGYSIQIPFLFREFRIPRITFSKKTGRELIGESSSLFLAKISNVAGDNIEPSLVAATVSPEMAVAMTQTGKLAKLVPMFQNRVASSVFAGLSMQAGRSKSESKKVLMELLKLIIVSTFIMLTGTLLLTPSIVELWLSADLFAGTDLLTMMVAYALVTIIRDISASFLITQGQSRWTGRVLAVDVPIRIGSLVILTPWFGVYGIAASFLLSTSIVGCILGFRLMASNDISLKEIGRMSASSIVAFSVCILTSKLFVWIPETWFGVGVATFGITLMSIAIVLGVDAKFRLYLTGYLDVVRRKLLTRRESI